MKHWVLLAAVAVGCGSSATEPVTAERHPGRAIDFAFGALDGSVFTGENTRGRVTALLFVTTFDLPSQVAARRLSDAARTHVPKFNAVGVVLEAAENAVLVDVFRKSLGLVYPVAIADSVELRASPTFADVAQVPTLVLLDRAGRERHRHTGAFEAAELMGWLRAAER